MKKYYFIFLFPVMLFIYSCSDSSNPLAINLFPVSDDIKLGQQVDAEIRSKPNEYPILNNAQATDIVQTMVDDILMSSKIKYKDDFAYKVTLIKDDNTVNAFCTPGGYIYVYTGLIKFLPNEAALAGVLGHEIAHAELRHATTRMSQQYGVQILIQFALGSTPTQTEEIAANLLSGLALLKNSRADESNSDEKSFEYLQDSKWFPGAIKYFFENIKNQSGEPDFLKTLLSTHPDPVDRLEEIEEMIKDANLPAPTENNLFTDRYNSLKALL